MASLGPCFICFESLANGDPISRSHPCGHVAHSTCFSKWEEQKHRQRRRNGSIPCPKCKQPVASFDPIFVEVVKSTFMKDLESERDALQKELEDTKQEHAHVLHENEKELKQCQEAIQKLISMDGSAIRSLVDNYVKLVKHRSLTVNMSEIFSLVQDEVGVSLTDKMKQTIMDMVQPQSLESNNSEFGLPSLNNETDAGVEDEDMVQLQSLEGDNNNSGLPAVSNESDSDSDESGIGESDTGSGESNSESEDEEMVDGNLEVHSVSRESGSGSGERDLGSEDEDMAAPPSLERNSGNFEPPLVHNESNLDNEDEDMAERPSSENNSGGFDVEPPSVSNESNSSSRNSDSSSDSSDSDSSSDSSDSDSSSDSSDSDSSSSDSEA